MRERDTEMKNKKEKKQTGLLSHMKMRGSFAEMYSCFAEIQGYFPEI